MDYTNCWTQLKFDKTENICLILYKYYFIKVLYLLIPRKASFIPQFFIPGRDFFIPKKIFAGDEIIFLAMKLYSSGTNESFLGITRSGDIITF
jgi:hypothetical protein